MQNNQFQVQYVIGDIISKDSISSEQIIELNISSAKVMYLLSFVLGQNFLNLERKNAAIQPTAPNNYE